MNGVWVRRTAVASVLLVALVAAVVSYAHMQELAVRSGEGWRAWLIPLSVDGMLLAATLAIVERRRVRQPVGWVPWLGLALGVVASLAANVAAARADLVAQIVAAWPPVALAVSIETLIIVLRGTAPAAPSPAAASVAADEAPEPAEAPDVPKLEVPQVRAPEVQAPEVQMPDVEAQAVPVAPADEVPADEAPADLADRIVALRQQAVARGERPPGRRKVAAALGTSEHAVRAAVQR